ncbi:hypothetical protein [Ligilactobacillus animalis]|uniref:hypothetical protein n=1 Tax=Ligilactobacillus animalis TaxID=1605 RepID=UPI002FDA3E0A
MFDAVIAALNKEQKTVVTYQNMLEPLVERDLTSYDALRLDLLEVLSPAQHVRLEKLLIEKAIAENDPTFWSYAVHQLFSNDSEEFETFRGKILEHTVSLLQGNLTKENINEYLDIINKFDVDGKYTTVKLECMLKLNRVAEAKMLAYSELPESEREEFLAKQEQKENELRLKIEKAINKGEDIFVNNPEYVYVYLTGGLLPAEYAVIVGRRVEYVDAIISKMERETPIINRYQFTLNELAARNYWFNYFADINHEALPTEGNWAKVNKFVLNYGGKELQKRIDHGVATIDEVESYVKQHEKVQRNEEQLAEDFDKRVTDRIEELKNEIQGRLSLEENHLDNKISKLDAANELAVRNMQQLMSDEHIAKLNVLLFMDQLKNVKIKQYDPDKFRFKYIYGNEQEDFVDVPIEVAPKFRDNFRPKNCSDVVVIVDEDNDGKPLVVTKYHFMGEEYYLKVCYMW